MCVRAPRNGEGPDDLVLGRAWKRRKIIEIGKAVEFENKKRAFEKKTKRSRIAKWKGNMLMSPDSSSADPDPIQSSYHSVPSMIQVPECTQSHGGSAPVIIKPHHIQIVDYKKIEQSTNGYMSPTKVQATPVFHQKPSMGPKSDEDLNLGKQLTWLWRGFCLRTGLISCASKWGELSLAFIIHLLTQFAVLGRTLTLNLYELRLCWWRWKKFDFCLCWFRSRSRAVHENKRKREKTPSREEWAAFIESQCQWKNFLDYEREQKKKLDGKWGNAARFELIFLNELLAWWLDKLADLYFMQFLDDDMASFMSRVNDSNTRRSIDFYVFSSGVRWTPRLMIFISLALAHRLVADWFMLSFHLTHFLLISFLYREWKEIFGESFFTFWSLFITFCFFCFTLDFVCLRFVVREMRGEDKLAHDKQSSFSLWDWRWRNSLAPFGNLCCRRRKWKKGEEKW